MSDESDWEMEKLENIVPPSRIKALPANLRVIKPLSEPEEEEKWDSLKS